MRSEGGPEMPAAPPWRVALDAVPLGLLALGLVVWWLGATGPARSDLTGPALEPVTVSSAAELESVFIGLGYDWPPQRVPAIAVQRLPPDLAEVTARERKSLFLRSLLPLVLAENARIAAERRVLLAVRDGGMTAAAARRRVGELAARYRVDGASGDPATVEALLQRVDVVPPALALAQAANESGWGTSRFAREGNNLFGEWTWNADQGLEPRSRAADASHYVRRFRSLRASVRSYLHNLNSHQAYAALRERRAAARRAGRPLRAGPLAEGLAAYSERGAAYIAEIRTLLRQNRLADAIAGAELVDTERLAQR